MKNLFFLFKIYFKVFSVISKKLNRSAAVTPTEMKKLLKDAFKDDVDVSDVSFIFDIVGWMNGNINKIENYSRPHNFKFEKIAGEVNLFYRHWSSSEEWTNAGKIIQNNLTLDLSLIHI